MNERTKKTGITGACVVYTCSYFATIDYSSQSSNSTIGWIY